MGLSGGTEHFRSCSITRPSNHECHKNVFPTICPPLKPSMHFPGAIPSTGGGFEVVTMQKHKTRTLEVHWDDKL